MHSPVPDQASPDAPAVDAPRVAKPRSTKTAPGAPSAEILREMDRLLAEGLLLRHASLQRRFHLRGPLVFSESFPPAIAPATSFKELAPWLKKVPAGWEVTAHGFEQRLSRPDAAAMAKLINARRDELGVFNCERDAGGYKLVFEF